MSYNKTLNYYLEHDVYRQEFSPYERSELITSFDFIDLKTDDVLYTSKFSSHFLYFITKGSMTLYMNTGRKVVVEAGHYFGEEAVLGLSFYSSKAIANTECHLIKIPAEDFQKLQAHYPENHYMIENYNFKLTGYSLPTFKKFQPKITPSKKWFSEEIMWSLSIIIPLFIYCIFPKNFYNQDAHLFVTIVSSIIVLWVFSLLPRYILALILFIACLWLKIAPPEIIFYGFAHPSFLALFSIFALGITLTQSNIFDRLIMFILKYMPATSFWTNISIFILGLISTIFIPFSSQHNQQFSFYVKRYYQQLGLSSTSQSAQKIIISAYSGSTIFSSIFLTSSIYNIFVFNIISKDPDQFQWAVWLNNAFAVGFFLLIFFGISLSLFFKNDEKLIPIREQTETQLRIIGKFNFKDKILMCLYGIYFLILGTESYHNISWIYILTSFLILLIIFNFLSFNFLINKIDWSVIMFIGMMTGILKTTDYLHLINPLLPYFNFLITLLKLNFVYFILLLAFSLSFIRIFLPYDLTIVLGLVFLLPFAQNYGLNLWLIGFLILLFSKESLIPRTSSDLYQFLKFLSQEKNFSTFSLWKYHFMMLGAKISAVICSISFWKDLNLI